jgi:inosine-uridine nucleoside N-ribohydrolase
MQLRRTRNLGKVVVAIALLFSSAIAFCTSVQAAEREKVIYDTDPGIDDAMGLILLARSPDFDLLGVTTVFGNSTIENTTRNALFLKDYLGFLAPVARGAAKPLYGDPPQVGDIHGANGLGNYDIPPVRSHIDPRPADQMIIDLVRANPHQVTIVSVGRLTNLAMALAEAPDLTKLAKRIIIMGGAFGYSYGGQRTEKNIWAFAEANIAGDPSSAEAVINAGWDVTLIPLDVTVRTVMDKAYLDSLPGKDGELIRGITKQTYVNAEGATAVHDSSAIFYALRPSAYTTVEGLVRVGVGGMDDGQTMIVPPDSENLAFKGRPVVRVAVGVDAASVLSLYRETIGGKK